MPALESTGGCGAMPGWLRGPLTAADAANERGMGGMRIPKDLRALSRQIAAIPGTDKSASCPSIGSCEDRFYPAYMSKPFFSRADWGEPARVSGKEHDGRLRDLLSSPLGERTKKVIQHLASMLAPILGVPLETIDPDCSLTDFGLDSLMALEFRNRINSDFGLLVPTVKLLQGPLLKDLAAELASRLAEPETNPATQACDSVFEFPLSFGQQDMWFGHKIMLGSAAFNIGFTVKATPRIEWRAFERAVAKLTARHAALRTVFFENEAGVPMQRVLTEVRPAITLIDVSSWAEEQLNQTILQDFQRPLDLDRPMFCVSVFRSAEADVLFFKVDHIVIDHWSRGCGLRIFASLYSADLTGAEAGLPPLKAQYWDFVESERSLLEGPGSGALWEYWKQKLGGELPILRLPSSGARAQALMAAGRALPLRFDAAAWNHGQRIARESPCDRLLFPACGFSSIAIWLYGTGRYCRRHFSFRPRRSTVGERNWIIH